MTGNGGTARLKDESDIDATRLSHSQYQGDNETRRRYYETLEEASSGDNSAFVEFIEDVVIQKSDVLPENHPG